MSQHTLVVKVPRARQAALRGRLAGGKFEHRQVPHAQWSVKGEGVVATLYNSGKLVVQGPAPEDFLARFTDEELPPEAARAGTQESNEPGAMARVDEPTVGSDETGKGDYFGPLVVAAVRVEPEQVARLDELSVMDSKKLTDLRAIRIGAALREEFEYAIERLDPEDYNREHSRAGNLNPLLAELHARAIRRVARDGDRVLVDQFAAARVMQEALQGADVRLEQAHRAEANPAVAAASILARQEFLACLEELSSEFDVDLHKGAGRPTDAAGRRFVDTHGADALLRVAKLHFKNTGKILGK